MKRFNWFRFLILWVITAGTIAVVGILIPGPGKRTMIAGWAGGIVVWLVATGVSAVIQNRPRSE